MPKEMKENSPFIRGHRLSQSVPENSEMVSRRNRIVKSTEKNRGLPHCHGPPPTALQNSRL